jgi:hypothetical protein
MELALGILAVVRVEAKLELLQQLLVVAQEVQQTATVLLVQRTLVAAVAVLAQGLQQILLVRLAALA